AVRQRLTSVCTRPAVCVDPRRLASFFFSSRRRHTRLVSDWSSACALPILGADDPADPYLTVLAYFSALRELGAARRIVEGEIHRSEERRVGREGRSRGSPYRGKKTRRERVERGAGVTDVDRIASTDGRARR